MCSRKNGASSSSRRSSDGGLLVAVFLWQSADGRARSSPGGVAGPRRPRPRREARRPHAARRRLRGHLHRHPSAPRGDRVRRAAGRRADRRPQHPQWRARRAHPEDRRRPARRRRRRRAARRGRHHPQARRRAARGGRGRGGLPHRDATRGPRRQHAIPLAARMTTRSELTWPTVPALVRDAARRHGDAEAVVDGERRVTFAELEALVRRAARALCASGIERGDRVAVWAPNSLEWIVAALGVTTSGGVLVTVNTRFRGAEAAYVLERSGARVLFTVRGFLDTDYPELLADAELPALEHTVLLSGAADDAAIAWDAFLARADDVADDHLDARIEALGADDPSDIMYTSGTTGSPKGVVMAHGQTLRAYLDWCDWAGLRAGDRYLIANPFFHIFGYKAGCLACLMRGATNVPVAVFDVERVLELVEREHITVLPGPPTLYQSLLDHPG